MNIITEINLNSCHEFLNHNSCPFTTVITKGASAELIFSFKKYSYLFDPADPFKYIDQLTFIFKQDDNIYYFEMFKDEDKTKDSNFGYNSDLEYISLLLSPAETANFDVANEYNPVQFEIAIKVNTDNLIAQKVDSVIIEKQLPILVVDSLYSEAQLYK